MAEMGKKEPEESVLENDHFWRFPTSLSRRSVSKTKPQNDEDGFENFSMINLELTRYKFKN